jgi:hypothetical protein
VKEKFGELRFYMTGYNDEIDKLIDAAEDLSARTCEICGQPGELRDIGWLYTWCDTCFEAEKLKRNRTQPLVKLE